MGAQEAFDPLGCLLVNDAELLDDAFLLFTTEVMELPEITPRLHNFQKNKRGMPAADNIGSLRAAPD